MNQTEQIRHGFHVAGFDLFPITVKIPQGQNRINVYYLLNLIIRVTAPIFNTWVVFD